MPRVDEWPYVIASYVLTWAVLAAYGWYLWRQWTQASRDAQNPGDFR
jgi:DNA-binding transcriptional regulator of glucitol operon